MLSEIWSRTGWKLLGVSAAVGVYLDGLRYVQLYGDTSGANSMIQETAYTISAPILVLFASFTAAFLVEKGAEPFRTYLKWLLAAAVVATVIRFVTRDILVICCSLSAGGAGLRFQMLRLFNGMTDVVSTGGFFMLAFHNRRSETRALEAVRIAELNRLQLERRLIESRLAAAQAQIDPQRLYASMDRVRDLLVAGSPDADASLDELIQELRNGLKAARQ
jgi:hypothetical protein